MELQKTAILEVVTAKTVEVQEVEILSINDDRSQKEISASVLINKQRGAIVIKLWSGEEEYTAAGQWTDADADKRLLEILSK